MYADIVLPADTALERTDCHWAYGSWYLGINKPVIEPLGESINNTELFRMLANKWVMLILLIMLLLRQMKKL